MNLAIKEFVKKHRYVYMTYFYIMSCIINVIRLFIKPDNKLILFVSYGGKHFSDSPKTIFEALRTDKRFKDYRFVWGFVNPNEYNIPGAETIKIDTIKYYLTALRARVWITNVIIERALRFRGKKTFYLCTSHGIPLKRIKKTGNAFQRLYDCLYDAILAQSEFDAKIQQEEFGLPPEKIVLTGYPRNDKFLNVSTDIINKIKKYYKIAPNKKVILYAPTYRDWNNGIETIPIHIEKWRETLSEDYILLFRAHPTVKICNLPENDSFFQNVTSYEDLDELLIASDILISDYSSMFFDYSILHRPMICWAYDYDKFSESRDLQVNLLDELSGGRISEEDLISILQRKEFEPILEKTIAFQKKYVSSYGVATSNTIELIYKNIR